MKVILGLLVPMAALLLVGCGGGGGVEARLKSQFENLSDGNWRAIYESCSPSWQEDNSFDSFQSELQFGLEFLDLTGEKFQVTDIRVEESGNVAEVSYTIKVDGEEFESEEGERWVKENGKWYQENCD